MNRAVILLILLTLPLFAFTHNGYLTGIVKEKGNGDPLPGANIFVRELSVGTSADLFGRFHLTLRPGTYTVEVSFIGYGTQVLQRTVNEHETTVLEVSLETGAVTLSDVVVSASPLGGKTAHLSSIDIALRAVNSSQEVLRMVPGLFIAQHAGGGKAEQIFLRGFDIDHGTDIRLSVDGMPVNMVSHAHGQGYSDLHFLIPETIHSIDFDKGPHAADEGNFATAGHVSFNTLGTLHENSIKLEGGTFGLFRNVNLVRLFDKRDDRRRDHAYVATEFLRSDGYFESPQGFHRLNLLGKFNRRITDRKVLSVSLSAFSSKWNASGQIPERAVSSGSISRYGAVGDGEGGKTSRFSLNASATNRLSAGLLEQTLYAIRYEFDLLSNFTFFLNDPLNGDRIRQLESRNVLGYMAALTKEYQLHTLDITSVYDAGVRYDFVDDVSLNRVADLNTVITPVTKGDVREGNAYGFTEYTFRLASRFSIRPALRFDLFSFRFNDALSPNSTSREWKGVISPKLSMEYDVTPLTRLFVKAGYGFHSNDTRVIVSQDQMPILPRAFGVDAGTQWKPFRQMFVQAAAWFLDLQQELIYVGDEGIVEPSGATRRNGLELSIRYQLNENFYTDADISYTIARNRKAADAGKYIPLAPPMTSTGGLQYNKNGFKGSIRYRYLADRPANEDNTLIAKGYMLLDANLSYTIGKYTVRVVGENILNRNWYEAQFETTSRLRDELLPVTEIHFTPGTPVSVRASLEFLF